MTSKSTIRREMSTRADVARRAGVSVATVSHVLNGTKFVSSELRKKVIEAVHFYNYKPNMIARSLSTKRTKNIGVLVDDITNPYYAEIAQGMDEVAQKHGYIVSLRLAGNDSESCITSIMQQQMDGLLIMTTRFFDFTRKHFEDLANSGVVLVNDPFRIGSFINFKYRTAMDNLFRYLADLGHTDIGYLSGIPVQSPGNDRYLIYRELIKKYGLTDDKRLVVDGMYPYKTDHQTGYEAMNTLLSRDTRVTAVFTTNDYMAFGAIKAIKEAGLRIPHDISVCGCDDVFLTEYIEPPLTTIRVHKKEMGRQAMYMILNEIEEGKHTTKLLEADLVIRGSTGPAK